jgi:hypothetical protein
MSNFTALVHIPSKCCDICKIESLVSGFHLGLGSLSLFLKWVGGLVKGPATAISLIPLPAQTQHVVDGQLWLCVSRWASWHRQQASACHPLVLGLPLSAFNGHIV